MQPYTKGGARGATQQQRICSRVPSSGLGRLSLSDAAGAGGFSRMRSRHYRGLAIPKYDHNNATPCTIIIWDNWSILPIRDKAWIGARAARTELILPSEACHIV